MCVSVLAHACFDCLLYTTAIRTPFLAGSWPPPTATITPCWGTCLSTFSATLREYSRGMGVPLVLTPGPRCTSPRRPSQALTGWTPRLTPPLGWLHRGGSGAQPAAPGMAVLLPTSRMGLRWRWGCLQAWRGASRYRSVGGCCNWRGVGVSRLYTGTSHRRPRLPKREACVCGNVRVACV